jgi:hypothetical protein
MSHEYPPEIQTSHLLSMCDDTGLFQHAVHAVPDRSHGYCIDDNARALLVSCALNGSSHVRLSSALTSRFASFIQHAWNPDRSRFRNFMSFDRRWLEESGSEDSHGRTLWALGVCAAQDTDATRREWAAVLFERAIPIVARFRSPRAWAFALLGLGEISGKREMNPEMVRMQETLAAKLQAIFEAVASPDWVWFEEGLSYDNARLSQAMIVTGLSLGVDRYIDTGLKSLRWLAAIQTASAGHFRPVGSMSFGDRRKAPKHFDQPAQQHSRRMLIRGGMPRPCAPSTGSWEKTIWDWLWSMSPVEVAATVFIPTAETRTAAANPWYHICWRSSKSGRCHCVGRPNSKSFGCQPKTPRPCGRTRSSRFSVADPVLQPPGALLAPRFGTRRGPPFQARDGTSGSQSDRQDAGQSHR